MPDIVAYANWLVENEDKKDTPDFNAVATAYQELRNSDPEAVSFNSQEREMEDFTAMDRFKYGFKTEEGLSENLGIYLESVLPIGNIFAGDSGHGFYASPTELYGEDFLSLEPEQRRQRIQEVRHARQLQEYPELTRLSEEGEGSGVAGFTGTLLKAIADPTTLLPIGKTLPAMAAMGGLVSGGYEAARGLAEEGEIDPLMTGAYTLGGAVLAPALAKTFGAIAPAYNKLKSKIGSKRTVKNVEEAEALVDQINSKMMQLKAEGIEDSGLLLAAAERLQLNPDKMQDAIIKSAIKLDIPWSQDVNKAVLETANALSSGSVTNDLADRIINTTIRQVKKFSPAIANRLQKFEMDQSVISAGLKQKSAPFMSLYNKLPRNIRPEFTKRLYNSDWDGAAQLAKSAGIRSFKVGDIGSRYTSNVDEAMKGAADVLNEIHNYSNSAIEGGVPFIQNYFPRVVKDYQGMLRALGQKEEAFLNSQLKRKAKDLGKKVEELTEKQKIDVLNSMLSGSPKYAPKGAGWRKQRAIENIDDDLMRYYSDDAADSLASYIDKTVNHVEKYKFFNANNAISKSGSDINIDESVGALVNKIKEDGNFKGSTEDLKNILKTRFGAGEESPHAFWQNLRSITNTVLLGNPMSALIQLGDQFVNIYRYGGDGGKAILESILGRTVTNIDDFGLAKYMATDIADVKSAAKGMQDVFMRWSGFRAVDRFGKNSLLQGAWNKATRLARSEKGVKAFKKEWGETFGDEFDSLVNDLQSGKVTENVKLLLWNELSGSQPISLSDMPQQYLAAPNGRVLYQLRSFTLKQIQLLQDSVTDEVKKGNYAQAGKNALAYTAAVGGGNAAVQELRNVGRGRDFDLDRLPDHVLNYLLSTALTSKYAMDRFSEGDVRGAVEASVMPPFRVLGDVANDVFDIGGAVLEGKEIDPKDFRRVPGLGDLYYNLFGGGAEEFLEKERKDKYSR
jgi:hypothetical protein